MQQTVNNFVLSRLGLGANFQNNGLEVPTLQHWLDKQLHPDAKDDPEYLQRLSRLQLRIKYDVKDGSSVDEMRPLQWLDSPIESLWQLNDPGKNTPNAEKARPRIEVAAATLLRAVYSKWQLKEVLCDFWHNHFNVNAGDNNVSIALPVYDRETIRPNCMGNFRQMLESVAKSPAMLWYLNNRSSKSGAPNENFAREFFELHTFGRDAYLNGLYNHWKDVPGALEGKPKGYIDQDVYEAARAFTGWSVEDGTGLGGGQTLPRTGRFVYVESWHDNYQKRILADDIDPYQSAMTDGYKVLDLAAEHPATAHYLCKKLCIRLVSDFPSEALVNSSAKIWLDTREKPDQIAQVVRHIALSKEFGQSQDAKIKRPLELVASYVRATGIEFTPTEGLINEINNAGQRLYAWPTPTGHPDNAEQWLGPNTMRRRWTLIAGLTDNWWGTGTFDAVTPVQTTTPSTDDLLAFWLQRLYTNPKQELSENLLASAKLDRGSPLNNPGLARHLVALAAMAPDYQLR